jgi:archaetidylinositol phosphate synthase
LSHNTLLHRIVRPLVRPLARTSVTPNHLTALRLVGGMGAAALFAAGETWWLLAAVVFVLSALLDRADGELARQTGRMSRFGHRFDLLADYGSHVALFVGIGIGLRHGALGSWSLLLGLIAGLAIISIFALVARIERIAGSAAAAFPTAAGFDPDDAILVIAPAALFGAMQPLLIAAAIGAPLFLAWSCWRFRDYLPGPTSARKAGS